MFEKGEKVNVVLIKEPNEPEPALVSFVEDMKEYLIGELIDEPKQNFGYHKGEIIAFFPFTDDRGTTVFISDMNPSIRLTEADLEDGKLLEEAVTRFNENRCNETIFEVLELLRDSVLYVPFNAVLSDRDQKRLEELIDSVEANAEELVGKEFETLDGTRYVPDILENSGAYFFPVFSTEEAMGEYGEHFSKLPLSILDIIPLARNNHKEPVGIVLNAFSEPFILDKELWEIVENMKSRLVEE